MNRIKAVISGVLVTLTCTVNADPLAIGKQAYHQNCKACHAIDRFTAGPSLVEILSKYPKNKQAAFIAWAENPGKKNPNTIPMPPMAHVGKEKLSAIHHYISVAAKHIKERKSKPKFAQHAPPPRTYPYVRRGYMPFSSPAAIAVGLHPKLALNWDASTCRINYAFPGQKNFFKGERKENELVKDIFYWETSAQLWSFAENKAIAFEGYEWINGHPQFTYRIGDTHIRETISLATSGLGFVRHFQLQGIRGPQHLNLADKGQAKITANKGEIKEQKLILSEDDLRDFTIEVNFQ